jgi:hypothetical protein
MNLRVILLLIALALVATGMWLTSHRPFHPSGRKPAPSSAPATRAKPEVPIQDGKTIDFSSGQAEVKGDPKEQAAIAQAVAELNAAAGNVTFTPKPASTGVKK